MNFEVQCVILMTGTMKREGVKYITFYFYVVGCRIVVGCRLVV